MKVLAPALAVMVMLPQLSTAEIYKSTDAEGNVTFSDTPSGDGPSQQVELPQTNTSAPPPDIAPLTTSESDAGAEQDDAIAYKVAIMSPANETTIPMGPGNFSVSASVDPAPAGGSLLQLYVDGTASGEPQSGTSWSLTNVFRGGHDLTVGVVDKKGKQLAVSAPVRVYVLRPSVNFKNRN